MSFPKKVNILEKNNEQYYNQEKVTSSLSKQSTVLDAFQIKSNT